METIETAVPGTGTAKTVDDESRTRFFERMFVPSLVYALFSTIFLYNNFSSVTLTLFGALIIGFTFFLMKNFSVKVKRGCWFCFAVMILLSISSAFTANRFILFFNFAGIVLVYGVAVLHLLYNDTKWSAGKYFLSLLLTLLGSVECLGDFAKDAKVYSKKSSPSAKNILYVFIGILIAIPLVAFAMFLFHSADLVFGRMMDDIMERISVETVFGVIVFFIVMFVISYCGVRYAGKKSIKEEVSGPRQFSPVVAVTVLFMMTFVYLAFSLIQIKYLFLGNGTLPDGYGYSYYARQGFFQLLTVSVMNLVIVLFTLRHFKDNMAVKILLFVFSCCTYIMIASAALRMGLYIKAYRLTAARIIVLWTLAVLAVLLTGLVLRIFVPAFPLFRFSFVVVCLSYLCLSYCRMDKIVARVNLQAGCSDYDLYLMSRELSCDAAFELIQAGAEDEDLINRLEQSYSRDFEKNGIRTFNFSRYKARKLIEEAENLQKNSMVQN
jgi:hypothetical protein